jgi:GDSL-like Lipase/Acylhydrolase family
MFRRGGNKGKLLLITILVFLAASLAANTLLVRALVDAFAKVQFARIFPLGFVPDEKLPPGPRTDLGNPSLALWGDSRAYLWNTSSLGRTWDVRNRAQGAETSSQLLLQLETSPASHATCSVVQIGINDLHPLGLMGGHRAEILRRLRANLLAIRDELLKRSDRVVLTTIFPPSTVPLFRRFAWDPRTLDLISQMNAAIIAAARGQRVVVLDANALLRAADGHLEPRYRNPDFFLHVNRTAYERLNLELGRLCAVDRAPAVPTPVRDR